MQVLAYVGKPFENACEHLRISCEHRELATNCIRKPTRKHIRIGVKAALANNADPDEMSYYAVFTVNDSTHGTSSPQRVIVLYKNQNITF